MGGMSWGLGGGDGGGNFNAVYERRRFEELASRGCRVWAN
jgi:hypothetical protein